MLLWKGGGQLVVGTMHVLVLSIVDKELKSGWKCVSTENCEIARNVKAWLTWLLIAAVDRFWMVCSVVRCFTAEFSLK